ncbi:hypothetical protein [Streptomyces sp. NPDC090057]|uniref:hypothetical protein n=1 Tax=Streptomyces sp. NPDC090057 TaxID=3365935 RepID=UPI00380891C7
MSKICVVGNSVAATRSAHEAPLAGWGQFLQQYVTPFHEVRNYARDAMTARGYFAERFVDLLNLLDPGDLVLFNFGLVEQRIGDPQSYHGPHEFKEFLHLYVQGVRGEGAIPALVTQTARCSFDASGRVADTGDGYPQLVREVAAETETPLIDLHELTLRFIQDLGPQYARQFYRWLDAGEHPNHPDGIIDSSHLNERGAREFARLVAGSLQATAGIPQGFVDLGAVAVAPAFPPPLAEFTIDKPEMALFEEFRVGSAPLISNPAPHALVGPMQKFVGTAAPGTSYLLFFENGIYLGGTRVGDSGVWGWRKVVNWHEGPHLVQAVGFTEQGVTPVAEFAFTVKTRVKPPVVTGPREGAWTGPRPRFSGTAEPGVSTVAVLEGGRLIATAPVDQDGSWKVTHPHDWKPGSHLVQFVAVFGATHSAPVRHAIRVHGVPEGNWLKQSLSSREPCSGKCDHLPFSGRW